MAGDETGCEADQAAESLHVETVALGQADYGAAFKLMFREALRSPYIRRRVLRRSFLFGVLSGAAGLVISVGYHLGNDMLHGRSAWHELTYAAQRLPFFAILLIACGLVWTGWRIAKLALMLRSARRRGVRDVPAGFALTLAWNEQRFGVVVDGRLHASPLGELQAWSESATHLFAVIPEAGTLVPIPLDRVDPAAADRLRRAMARADVPILWTRLERELFLTVKELQAPGMSEIFS